MRVQNLKQKYVTHYIIDVVAHHMSQCLVRCVPTMSCMQNEMQTKPASKPLLLFKLASNMHKHNIYYGSNVRILVKMPNYHRNVFISFDHHAHCPHNKHSPEFELWQQQSTRTHARTHHTKWSVLLTAFRT